MIRITVELLSAKTGKRTLLGVSDIWNDGEETQATDGDRGSYHATFSQWAPNEKKVWKRGRVTGFARKTRGPWDLLFLALRSAVGLRNPDVEFIRKVVEKVNERRPPGATTSEMT